MSAATSARVTVVGRRHGAELGRHRRHVGLGLQRLGLRLSISGRSSAAFAYAFAASRGRPRASSTAPSCACESASRRVELDRAPGVRFGRIERAARRFDDRELAQNQHARRARAQRALEDALRVFQAARLPLFAAHSISDCTCRNRSSSSLVFCGFALWIERDDRSSAAIASSSLPSGEMRLRLALPCRQILVVLRQRHRKCAERRA